MRTLPVGLRGSTSIQSTDVGHLKPARRSRAKAMISSSVDVAAGRDHDDRLGRLAPPLVGHADDGDVGDAGMGHQHVLDLGRVHVLAAGHDHVLHPVVDVEVAVVVEVAGVAGAEPAVRR